MQLFDLLAHNALVFPDKAALRIGDQSWTFTQVLTLASEFTQRYQAVFSPGDRVALWFNNSINWYVAFIALGRLGVVAAPINTRLTPKEVTAILNDLGACALITVSHHRGRQYLDEARQINRDLAKPLRLIDASPGQTPSHWAMDCLDAAATSEPNPAGLDDVLCIQYTSGTTALPKGAMLRTQAYLQTASHVARCQRLTPSSSFISAAPFFHCSGTMHAISVCLIAGCTLHSLDVWDPERFLWTTEKYRCDVSHMIYFRDVLALGSASARQQLATLQIGHELGTPEFLRRVHDELDIPGLSNIYGMTETCGQFTMWFPDDPLEARLSGNGRTQPGNVLRIVDREANTLQAPGELGEIQMKGSTLHKGYFNRPAADRQAWTEDGWFRSGDLGWVSEAGVLHYLSRIKDVIRVGGENFAPSEVEQVIRDLSGFSQVCVIAMPDERLDEVPVAVVSGSCSIPISELRQRMKAQLASYKLPRHFYWSDDIPMTATNRPQKHLLKHWVEQSSLKELI